MLVKVLVADPSFNEETSSWVKHINFSLPPDNTVKYFQAYKDSLNQSIIEADVTLAPRFFGMYIDDNMYADIRKLMTRAIAASIESLFII